MTDESIKHYAKIGTLCSLLALCENLRKSAKRSEVVAVKAAAEAYLELCDEEEDDT